VKGEVAALATEQGRSPQAPPSATQSVTVLAFDFGMRHVGVAVGDTGTRMAHALGVVGGEGTAACMAAIEPLVDEWRPARLVVGLPLSLDGAEQGMSARARRFARQLSARFCLPVDLADERFSSTAAGEGLREAGRGGAKHKRRVHAEAARIILQSWLDEAA
jgi:putative Holliday junction resolvase